jgi:hypothetical protein
MKELSRIRRLQTGNSYPVDANAQLVPPFKALSMRLAVDEVGVVRPSSASTSSSA